MEKKKHCKIYRAVWWKRAVGLLIFTPIMLFITTITAAAIIDFSVRSLQARIWWGYFLSAPFIVFTIVGWWLWWHGLFVDRLEISEEGIAFYAWGFNGWIRWDNLVDFEYRWIYFRT